VYFIAGSCQYKLQELGELYRMRWAIEEGYKMYKARTGEAFSGKTAVAVKQDIYAKSHDDDLVCCAGIPIEERVVKEYQADQKKDCKASS